MNKSHLCLVDMCTGMIVVIFNQSVGALDRHQHDVLLLVCGFSFRAAVVACSCHCQKAYYHSLFSLLDLTCVFTGQDTSAPHDCHCKAVYFF